MKQLIAGCLVVLGGLQSFAGTAQILGGLLSVDTVILAAIGPLSLVAGLAVFLDSGKGATLLSIIGCIGQLGAAAKASILSLAVDGVSAVSWIVVSLFALAIAWLIIDLNRLKEGRDDVAGEVHDSSSKRRGAA